MKDNYSNKNIDEIIKESMKIEDKPTVALNNKLKARIYQQEAVIRTQQQTRKLSLWYLPMLVNVVIFLLLAVVSVMTIQNIYLSYFVAGVCVYIGIAGVFLTIVGVKRTNMKENLTIYIKKRGVFA